ncbi:hypothetical protein CBS101457_006031 [Exobasidium rhododendri]|nr:hypothetical protein CBS101457_006031 [Exobasidium rhododendri]
MGPAAYHRSDNPEKYRENANFVYNDENTREVLKLLDAQPGDMILDVGCGTGELTERIHAIVSSGKNRETGRVGMVYGIDAALTMVQGAKEKSGAPDLEYEVCDGHDIESWLKGKDLIGKFDKVFSNAALHWMKTSPQTVVEGMSAALRPSGRLAIEMGGHLNVIGVRSTLHAAIARRNVDPTLVDPWYFPTPAAYCKLLERVGLRPTVAYLHPRPTPLPQGSGLLGWLETFAGPFINSLASEEEKKDLLSEVEKQVKIDMYDQDSDQWTLMYVRTRVQATKE